MKNTFPFTVTDVRHLAIPGRYYRVLADLAELDDYYALFEKYGFSGSGSSWVEHITTIVEEFQPALLDHLEFDEEDETFLVYADSEAAATQFLDLVQPIFADLGTLNKYFSQVDPADFFE
ncbi:MAG: hypothetical protein H7Z21_19520 [Hymenobacter sp.]|nr:hypothetical protein [Hymenobacter sp.]